MAVSRTTIMASEVIMRRVNEHTEKTGEKLSDFYNRAILNQLERENDFEIRDMVEKENSSEGDNFNTKEEDLGFSRPR